MYLKCFFYSNTVRFWSFISLNLSLFKNDTQRWFLCFQNCTPSRSSRQEVICKKGVLRNFTILHRTPLVAASVNPHVWRKKIILGSRMNINWCFFGLFDEINPFRRSSLSFWFGERMTISLERSWTYTEHDIFSKTKF